MDADLKDIIPDFQISNLLPNLIVSAAIIVCAIIIWKVVRKALDSYNDKQYKKDPDAKQISNGVINAIRIVVIIVVVLAVLQINGINVGGLIASLGITGAIIGLAIQDYLKDVIMGAHIKADHFFKVDDVVKFDGYEGPVIFFNSKTTKIKDMYTGEVISICNREITKIVKSSSQVDMDISIPYDIDPRKVHETMTAIAAEIGQIEHIKNSMYKGTQNFEDCSVIYKLRFYCSPHKRPELWRQALKVVQERLAEADIPIAVPIQEIGVTMREGN